MPALKTNYATGNSFPAADMNATNGAVNGAVLTGTYASMPAATQPSRLYYCTDTDAVYRDNGTSWDRIRFGVGGTNQALPPSSGWTATASGGASMASDKDGLLLTLPANSSSLVEKRAYPGVPFTLDVYLDAFGLNYPMASGTSFSSGIYVANAAGSTSMMFGPAVANYGAAGWPGYIWCLTVNGPASAFSGNNPGFTWIGDMPKWFRYVDNGTNITVSFSTNGTDYAVMYTGGRTAYLTPAYIGLSGNNNSGSGSGFLLRCRAWNVS